MSHIKQLITLSKTAAHRPDWVQGPGGNTSVKLDDGTMLIKASGCLLKEVDETNAWTRVNTAAILQVLRAEDIQPGDPAAMERINDAILASVIETAQQGLKPSMETAFHCLYPKYVLHTHNMWANILLCSDGFDMLENCFTGDEDYTISLLKDYYTPGAELSWWLGQLYRFEEAMPQVTLMPNHGIIIAAGTMEAVTAIHDDVQFRLLRYLRLSEKDYPVYQLDYHEGRYAIICDELKSWLLEYDADFIFEEYLFPDQIIYLNGADFSTMDDEAKIFFDRFTDTFYIKAAEKEAATIAELIIAVTFLYHQIKQRQLEPLTINFEIAKLRGLDSEQHRVSQLKK
jgi:ribulose-5-phosphate 4-epimerase/fuculose-1-phosphate aldolase